MYFYSILNLFDGLLSALLLVSHSIHPFSKVPQWKGVKRVNPFVFSLTRVLLLACANAACLTEYLLRWRKTWHFFLTTKGRKTTTKIVSNAFGEQCQRKEEAPHPCIGDYQCFVLQGETNDVTELTTRLANPLFPCLDTSSLMYSTSSVQTNKLWRCPPEISESCISGTIPCTDGVNDFHQCLNWSWWHSFVRGFGANLEEQVVTLGAFFVHHRLGGVRFSTQHSSQYVFFVPSNSPLSEIDTFWRFGSSDTLVPSCLSLDEVRHQNLSFPWLHLFLRANGPLLFKSFHRSPTYFFRRRLYHNP